jgi:predicted PilT family ATPase
VDKTDREVYKGIKEAEQEEEEEEEIEAVRIIEEEVIKKIGRLTMKMIKIKMPILIIIGVKMNKIPKIIKMKNQMINSVKKIIIITINIKNKANTKNMTS